MLIARTGSRLLRGMVARMVPRDADACEPEVVPGLRCASDPARLALFGARFTVPVYPGETIRTEIWHQAPVVQFRARVPERDSVVLNHGYAELREA